MKTQITMVLTVLFATAAARAQTLADYQNVINSQSPYYYNTLDDTLVPVLGTGTFNATSGATFTSDLFGNANDAVAFAASTDQLSDSTGNDIISGSGTPTPIGSMSLLFYTPNTDISATTGQYIFSDGDSTAGTAAGTGEFALEMTGGNLALKVANKTFTLSSLTGGMWYYFAATWNLNGTTTGVNGLTYYLGEAGGTLSSTFLQKGGSGNFSSSDNFGDGGAFVLSGHQAGGSGGFEWQGNHGSVDELATWNSQLSNDQITGQFDALITQVPESSVGVLFGAGGLLVLFCTRRFGRGRATVGIGK